MHCDVNQENSVEHIWECVDLIGVSRIDHGVNALEDPALCKVIAQRKLGLTVCPISNGFVTDDSQSQVIKEMLDRGMRVTVNSDDPAYFGGYIEENFELVQSQAGLGRADLAALSRNAFEAAWLPRTVKDRYIALVDELVSR
jgi:adenosine deaminase